MAAANEAERRRWNDPYWSSAWPRREFLTNAVTEVLLDRLALVPGERVLDVGTGGGPAALAAGHRVGATGRVVGADLSRPLIELARTRAAEQGATQVTFVLADLQVDPVAGGPFDVAMSQFGVMFFDRPVIAFTNIAAHVAPGGRLGFACWQPVDANPWFTGPALAPFVPPPPPLGPGTSPTGPFVLGDADRTVGILRSAGWDAVHCEPYQTTAIVDADAICDEGQPAFLGVPEDRVAQAQAAARAHLAPLEAPHGRYRAPLAFFIVTARRPAD